MDEIIMRYNYVHEGEAVKPYSGRMIDVMPVMKAEGRVPISVAGDMILRLQRLDKGAFPKRILQDNYVATMHWGHSVDCIADGAISHSDGRVKIVLDSQDLKDLTPQSILMNGGGFVLEDADIYEAARGSHIVEVTKADVIKYTGKDLFGYKALDNQLLRILARHPDEVPANIARDRNLLNEYVKAVFLLTREYGKKNMGIFVGETISSELSTLRPWRIGHLDDRSRIGSCNSLNSPGSLALGIFENSLEHLVVR